MIALIDLYQKELLKINGFSPSTVETYTLSINAFCRFAKNELEIDPVKVKGPQLLKWILYLKNTGIGHSRIENHHYALKSFFAFVKKTGIIDTNPAEALPLLITRRRQVTKPISTQNAFKLLDSFDQSSWHGLRDYTMISLLWALGLRTSELTGLKVRSFETGHGKRVGLLRVRGKNKKQRALFVADRLFDQLLRYLAHNSCVILRTPNRPGKNCLLCFRQTQKQRLFQITVCSVLSKIRQKWPVLRPALYHGCSGTLLPPRCITTTFLCPTFR